MGLSSRIIFGRVGRDAETRFMQDGKQVTNFSIAQDRGFYNDAKEWQDRVQWYKCAVFGQQAARAQQIKKGMLVIVYGTESSRAYIDNSGQPQASLEFRVEAFRFYQTVARNEQSDEPIYRDDRNLSDDDDLAF